MNSLPLISHRLFAAALASDSQALAGGHSARPVAPARQPGASPSNPGELPPQVLVSVSSTPYLNAPSARAAANIGWF